jgi:hypothetical protein
MPNFRLATFSAEVTPPLDHPLCGGWILPVRGVADPLKAIGVVLLGTDKPVVLCAVDWCGIRNDAHEAWRIALAEAAGTSIHHVAVQTVHPHNAPFADIEAQKLLDSVHGPPMLDLKWHAKAVDDVATAIKASLKNPAPFTHVGVGSAKIEQVASNRRILGPDGKVRFTRFSAAKEADLRAAPEGLIDPSLRTLSFWDGPKPLAALHYYATHPMSYYGDGMVSTDFCGLARQKLQDDNPNILQVYFTGCAGNIAAGKFNDGARENRPVLRDRIYIAMKASFKATRRMEVNGWDWRVEPVHLLPRNEAMFGEEKSKEVLADEKAAKAKRGNAAFQLAWLKRLDRPIDVTCLDFGGKVFVLHLPGEPFIEFQLLAQKMRPNETVLVAGYGDDGPGYLPTAKAYLEGGYEPTVALSSPDTEAILTKAMAKLLKTEVKN